MSTSYYIFTEVKLNSAWHCINGMVARIKPREHFVIAPTFHTDARRHFEKAFMQLSDDGYRIGIDELSENLCIAATEWISPGDGIMLAIPYDEILKVLNASGKEHCAFALRSDVADFENNEVDDICEYVSVKEYRQMNDELKKAYQYYEWNDRLGVYRYYDELYKKIVSQVQDWKTVNPREIIDDIRIILFTG